jgi:NTE family protein
MRALVLSGGGSLGSYEIGVLKYLIHDLQLKYDILCGVSVGALNCSYLSMYPKERENEALNNLLNIWETISTDQVYKRWFPFGKLHGLWKDSIYDSKPLIKKVHTALNLAQIRQSGRQIAVGACSLTTGRYTIFTQNDDCFVDAVLASASFPIGLKPIKIHNELYTDGGVKHVTPLKAAIDLGADELDIVINDPSNTDGFFENKNAITLGLRCVDLMSCQIVESDAKLAELYNKMVIGGISNKRLLKIKIVRPIFGLPFSSLNFDHENMMAMMEIGYNQAKAQYIPD